MDHQPTITLELGLKKIREDGTEKISRIASGDFQETLEIDEHMKLQVLVYNMCTQTTHAHNQTSLQEPLYDEFGSAIQKYCADIVLSRLQQKRDEFLLQALVKEHDRFKIYARMMKNVFNYLDRFFIARQGLPKLFDVGVKKFDEGVFDQSVGEEICKSTLELVQKDRDGEQIDRVLVRDVTAIYVALSVPDQDERDANDVSTKKYNTSFEAQFLAETRNYYSAKSVIWLQESLPEYLIKVEKALDREAQFAEDCLPGTTAPKLQKLLDEVLLEDHQKTLLERDSAGFSNLLADFRKSDLKRMHKLFARIPKGLDPLSAQFCKHVTEKGKELVETFDASKSSSSEAVTDFVDRLVKMQDDYSSLVDECFDTQLFPKAMKEAFEAFTNKDMGSQGSKVSCAELLSTYCDTILKSGAGSEKLSEDEMEEKLEKIVRLFTYLSDKDLFSEYYRKHLARRLLNKKSTSDDTEVRMLEMLKSQCGNQFTSKLEGMVKDLTTSKDLVESFKTYIEELPKEKKPSVDAEVQVLTTGNWPTYPIMDLHLPKVLSNCMELFLDYYNTNTKHRRLRWLHSLGSVSVAAVKGTFDKPYEFSVSTPQACILLLFNEFGSGVTFDEVRQHVNLDEDEAKRQLLTLSAGKYKVLTKDPVGKTLSPTDKFTINAGFKDRKFKIKIPTISSKELHKEDKASATVAVADDRKHAIEAAIVRIMKDRKRLEFQKLVLETSQQLMRIFVPDVKLIKSRMEDLITREYLERDPENPKVLRYLA